MTPPSTSNRSHASTAKAVAELAGVSVTTVSRVLNGRADAIPSETQQRVIAAAQELRYRPNSLAQALRSGTSQIIGLIVPDIADAYFHQVARGAEDVAQAAGCMVMLANTDRLQEKEQVCVDLLLDRRVDGIIFAGGGIDDDTHLDDVQWGSTNVVAIGPHQLSFPTVTVDDGAAVADAVNHVADTGARRVLCLAGQPNWLVTERRLAGYRRAVAARGLVNDDQLVTFGDFSQESGEERTRKALEQGEFDGIIAFNDYCAIGAMYALAAGGVDVPDDVAVVGCDDIPASQLVHPTLSSISFSQYEFGRKAAQLVLSAQPEPRRREPTTFPHSVVARESTAREPPTR